MGQYPLALLVLLTMISSIASSYYFAGVYAPDAVADRVMQRTLENEYEKVGGKENYDLVTTANRLSMTQQMGQIRDFVNQNGGTKTSTGAGAATAPVAAATSKITAEEIAAIKKSAYLQGKTDGRFLMLEYSDLECPFCIRQRKDRTIETVMQKYEGQIAFAFRNFRGVPHPGAEAKANALLCVGEVGGTDKYVKFEHAVLDRSADGVVLPVEQLPALAKEIGVDQKKFQTCVDSKKNIARFDAETAEGAKMGVRGTPGTVIIDTKTGEYTLVNGAYPASEFQSRIDAFLAKK